MHIFGRGSVISLSKAWRYGNFFFFCLVFFFSFSNDFCESGEWDRGALRDRARVRAEVVSAWVSAWTVVVSLIWQALLFSLGCDNSLPSQSSTASLFSVLAFFIFLQLSPFTMNLSAICGIRFFSSFP